MFNKRLLKSVDGSVKYILQTVLFQWLCLLTNIIIIFFICAFLQGAYLGTLTKEKFGYTVAVVLLCVGLRAVFMRASVNYSMLSAQNAKRILRQKVFSHFTKLGPSYSSHISTAEAVQVSVEGIDQLEVYFGQYMPQLFYAVVAPLTLFAVVVPFDLKTAMVLLIFVPLIPLSIIAVQKFAKKLLSKYWTAYTDLGDIFLENIQGLTTLKIYEADAQKHKEMNKHAELFRKATMRVLMMQLNSIAVMDIVAYGGAAAGILSGMLALANGNLNFFEAMAVILLSSEFFIPMRQLGSFFHIAMNGSAAADKIFRILDTPIPPNGEEEADGDLRIALENVSFSYDSENYALKHVSLSLEEGSVTALVGKSGCGKSTLSSLLTGKLKGYQGSILLGNTELSACSEAWLMQNVTLITANSYLFKGTVRDNLLLGKPNATEKELEEVLQRVNLLDFLKTENGLDTTLLEQGSNFSGGQKQRLSIARALLHDTPVYIFDEATSSIDIESEEIIMRLIHELAKTKRILLISHRLSNVVSADKIYLLENGLLKESGTHISLMTKKGSYYKLFQSQQNLENYANKAVSEIRRKEAQ